ncbi:Ribosomal protein S18 acetylase RimI [Halogranum amylolyticum]|uniref:Ribosomal protein S18 acetylase RimI n=1 Tax=Halogranum amylolyticum TaxID=660520 RepID=A0A1H8WE38_9EURY|nr:GNAT family N-acetyltransferase [Halogranum amylolyticum]SEP25934.1 Ribosomal protein S18 acetylase RimI [Halogranum amylolyticum]
MTIRRASADDVEAIRAVARASWTADYPTILSRETAESGVDEWYEPTQLRAELDRPATCVFVAERGDEVVGFVHALWNREEGVVFRVYVHPDHRETGIGSDLVDRVGSEMASRDADRLTAMVLADNEVGQGFYESLGFERVDEGETTIGGESYGEYSYRLEIPDGESVTSGA